MAKAAAKGEAKAAAPKTGPKTGKAGKAARPRSEIDDLITLIVCVACTIWACKAIIGLGVLSF